MPMGFADYENVFGTCYSKPVYCKQHQETAFLSSTNSVLVEVYPSPLPTDEDENGHAGMSSAPRDSRRWNPRPIPGAPSWRGWQPAAQENGPRRETANPRAMTLRAWHIAPPH